MNMRLFSTETISTVALLVLGILFVAQTQQSVVRHARQESNFLVPPEQLKYFTLGYSEITGDALWLRVIQDFDYCEAKQAEAKVGARVKCERGWVFHMIDSITEIAPRFRDPYLYGGLMLSVIVDDIPGASVIFDKGVERFPTDWIMLYRAAYHSLSEEKNEEKASHRLVLAGQNGAPSWVFSLSARLNQKLGRLDFAKSIMADALENAKDEKSRDLFEKRLAEIDRQIAEEQAKQKH